MENLKNKIKENVEKGFKAQQKYYSIAKELEELRYQYWYFWQNLENKESILKDSEKYEEATQKYNSFEKEIEKKEKQQKINKNIIAIVQNNLQKYIYEIMQKEGFNILKKYHNKNIGEKTTEKIEEDLEDFFKNNYNLYTYIKLLNSYYEANKKTIEIEIGDQFKMVHNDYQNKDYRLLENTLGLEQNRDFSIVIYTANSKEDLNRYEKIEDYTEYEKKFYKIIYYYIEDIKEIDLKDIEKTAKKIEADREKAISKIEKLKKEIETIRNYYNNNIEQNNTISFLRNNHIENK